MIRNLMAYAQILTDLRIQNMFWHIHQEFAKDDNYRLGNFIRALWQAVKDERIVKFENRYVYSSFLPPIPSKAALQVFNAVPEQGSRFFYHTHALRTAPISVYIAVTGRCCYNCSHCSAANRETGDELPLALITETVSDLQAMGTGIIGFTGGEPMLRKDIVDIVRAVDDRSVSYLFTSGNGLTRENAKALKQAGLFAIGISFDSRDETETDAKRGCPGAFQRALEAVEHARQAGLYIMLQTVVDKQMMDADRLAEMVYFGNDLGVHEIRFLENLPAGRLLDISRNRLLSETDREKLRIFHKQMNRMNRSLPKVSVFSHAESSKLYGCGAGTQHSYIDATGNLCPCDFVPLAFGNIGETPVRKLWPEMNRLIGKPRDICMILELHGKILSRQQNILPLSVSDSRQIACSLRKVDALPRFYTKLAGSSG